MMALGANADIVLVSARHQLLMFLSAWRFTVVLGVIQPAVFLLVTLGAAPTAGSAYAGRTSVAVLLTAFWSFTVWTGAGILRRERAEGTLAATLVSARDPRLVLVGKSLGASSASGVLIVVTITAVLLGLRQPVTVEHPIWFAVGLLVVLASGTALGMLLSCLFLVTRFGAQISSALMYPVFLLGGLLIPLSTVPVPLRWLSWLVSLHWVNEFLVSSTSGDPDLAALGLTGLLTAVYAVAGAVAFDRVSDLARRRGTLELV